MNDSQIEKLNSIFKNILELKDDEDLTNLTKITNESWDSLAQVSLISAIANEFSVDIGGRDFEMFTSYNSVKLLLEGKGS